MVQGFGNVGLNTAVILSKYGVSTIAVGDHSGYMVNPEGFNPHKLQEHVKRHRAIHGYPGGKPISRDEFFRIKADLFVPAALENQIGVDEAKALAVRLVAEGANGPCSPEGERILVERGVDILPDILVNSGGVTVSYYEWVQNKRSESWSLEEVDGRLEKAMKRAYREVVEIARQKKCSLRIAAYVVALQRIAIAYGERDIFPEYRAGNRHDPTILDSETTSPIGSRPRVLPPQVGLTFDEATPEAWVRSCFPTSVMKGVTQSCTKPSRTVLLGQSITLL